MSTDRPEAPESASEAAEPVSETPEATRPAGTSGPDDTVTEQVVVLGAGSGGLMVANRLDRELAGLVDVTVVDRDPTHRYQPAFYLAPFGYMDLEEQSRDARDYCRADVTFQQGEVTGIDPRRGRVELREGTLAYDRLIVALGHETAPETVPGMAEGWRRTREADADDADDVSATDRKGRTTDAGRSLPADDPAVYPFYEAEAAAALGDALDGLGDGDRLLVTVPDTPVSCGGAPLKLAMLAEDDLSRHGVDAEVVLARPDDHLFGGGEKARYDERLREEWAARDLELVRGFETARVLPDAGRVEAVDGRTLDYDVYAPVPPQRPPEPLRDGPLTDGGPDGYVTVDDHTLRHARFDGVYALGDCTDVPVSKTAAAARKQVGVVADNLTADATDRAYEATYDGFAACPLLTARGKAVMALYDYDGPLVPAVESRLSWLLDVHAIPAAYWQLWLKGYDPLP
jgi:sulfide:quinone oxidoreductase